MVSMFAVEEDRFESRNLDDSDAHSEATGTTEEDLRPVKVSCSLACIALYIHVFSPSFNCSLTHAFAHPFSHSCMHSSVNPHLPAKQPSRLTWQQVRLSPVQV